MRSRLLNFAARLRCLGLVAAAAAAMPVALLAQSLDGTLVVANRDGGSVSLFDLEAGLEVARLPIGPRFPHEVAVSPDGSLAIAGEYGPASNHGRHVVVIDIADARIVGRMDLGPASRPHSLAFLPDNRRAVVTMEESDRLALVDTRSLTVIRTYPTGGREGHMVRLSPAGERAYVTSRGAEGTLSVIYLEEDRPPTVIATGRGAEGLAVAPDGSEIWVVNRAAGSISIVDAASLQVVATIEAPDGAGRAEMSPSGRVLVPNGTSARKVSKYLSLYERESRRVVQQLTMNGGEPGAGAYSIHMVGETAFIADRSVQSIEMRSLDNFDESHILTRAHDGPDGMAYSPVRVAAMTR